MANHVDLELIIIHSFRFSCIEVPEQSVFWAPELVLVFVLWGIPLDDRR